MFFVQNRKFSIKLQGDGRARPARSNGPRKVRRSRWEHRDVWSHCARGRIIKMWKMHSNFIFLDKSVIIKWSIRMIFLRGWACWLRIPIDVQCPVLPRDAPYQPVRIRRTKTEVEEKIRRRFLNAFLHISRQNHDLQATNILFSFVIIQKNSF